MIFRPRPESSRETPTTQEKTTKEASTSSQTPHEKETPPTPDAPRIPDHQPNNKTSNTNLVLITLYLGYTGKALFQLLGTLLTCGILAFPIAIWAFIEGILILVARPGEAPWGVDASGMPLSG